MPTWIFPEMAGTAINPTTDSRIPVSWQIVVIEVLTV
jgi:hypothetical protein